MCISKRQTCLIGLLFILATAMGFLNAGLVGPVIGSPDPLKRIADNPGIVGLGALFNYLMAFGVVGIAVALHPVLKSSHPTAATGYLAARIIEGAVLALAGITWLALVPLAAEVGPPGPEAGKRLMADTLVGLGTHGFTLGAEITFGVSALILNVVFLRSGLVPRVISLWGCVAGGLILLLGTMKTLGLPVDRVEIAFTAPIALNEMVLAVWLIVRGLDRSERRPTSSGHERKAVEGA